MLEVQPSATKAEHPVRSELWNVVWFFGLVIGMSLPIWVLSSTVPFMILPGLPIAALSVVCPALSACLLSLWIGGWREAAHLLFRGLDARIGLRGFAGIMLINPILFGLAFFVAKALNSAIPLPDLDGLQVILLFALFLPTALLEETGWTGFALDRLQITFGPATSGVILGLFWAVWHYPALVQAGRSAEWVIWWTVWTVSARVLMVFLYGQTGKSVFSVALYHAMSNLCWQLYPVRGSHFDPFISGLITLAAAVTVGIKDWRTTGRRS